MAQFVSSIFVTVSLLMMVIFCQLNHSAPLPIPRPLRGGRHQSIGIAPPMSTMPKTSHILGINPITKDVLDTVSAKIKRGLDLDESFLIEVKDCEKLPKLFEDLKKPSFDEIDSPVNCPVEWEQKIDENQIPSVYYEAKCKPSDNCCNTKTGDYNCAPLKVPMLVLKKLKKTSSNGHCLYKPEMKTFAVGCACFQTTGGIQAATLDTKGPQQ